MRPEDHLERAYEQSLLEEFELLEPEPLSLRLIRWGVALIVWGIGLSVLVWIVLPTLFILWALLTH